MRISVASGKGGTGKTTVATNLALSIDADVQFIDCDVEQPNGHLFLRPAIERSETVTTPVPEIDLQKCTYCAKCADICRFKAIAVIPDTTVLVFAELCHSCGGCLAICPEGAVSETSRELGELEIGSRGRLSFVHGRLRVGEAMAPPLIKKVRQAARTGGITIIDAPPGTSCPVIAAMRDTDFVLLVTEPTPFGLHDLELAVGAVDILGIPRGLVINRSDLGDDRVWNYAEAAGIPVLMEIPFDRRVAEIYAKGEMMIEVMPEWKNRFAGLYDRVVEITAVSGTDK